MDAVQKTVQDTVGSAQAEAQCERREAEERWKQQVVEMIRNQIKESVVAEVKEVLAAEMDVVEEVVCKNATQLREKDRRELEHERARMLAAVTKQMEGLQLQMQLLASGPDTQEQQQEGEA
jgi:hypothetical protein